MANSTLRALVLGQTDHIAPASNDAMVDRLVQGGALETQMCIEAFRAVDRGAFWLEGSGAAAYADMPIRHGKLHQSAPHIYAQALESFMPLSAGMSFLNIGSGTGYFNSLIRHFLGPHSINDGIDIWPETIAHARERCGAACRAGIEFTLGNGYELDVNLCRRYDRVYVGACVSRDAEYLFNLLEVGGVLVAPFQMPNCQQMRRVVRVSEEAFELEVLNLVHFAALAVPPAATGLPPPGDPVRRARVSERQTSTGGTKRRRSDASGDTVATESDRRAAISGLPGVPFTFVLRPRPWTRDQLWAYPSTFQAVATAVLLNGKSTASQECLPVEIWEHHVLPMCSRFWFEPPLPCTSSAPKSTSASTAAFPRTLSKISRAAAEHARRVWSKAVGGAKVVPCLWFVWSSRLEGQAWRGHHTNAEADTRGSLIARLLGRMHSHEGSQRLGLGEEGDSEDSTSIASATSSSSGISRRTGCCTLRFLRRVSTCVCPRCSVQRYNNALWGA